MKVKLLQALPSKLCSLPLPKFDFGGALFPSDILRTVTLCHSVFLCSRQKLYTKIHLIIGQVPWHLPQSQP